jgi:hypothetical protein
MQVSETQLQQVINDVAAIRRALAPAPANDGRAVSEGSAPVHIWLHALVLIGAALILALDLVGGHAQTEALLYSASDPQFMMLSLVQSGGVLAVIVGAIYFLVWRGAQRAGESFEQFVTRNFRYLRSLSFVSDTLVKFTCLAVAIVAKRPDLTPPLLFVFMADYLVQGRLWVLPPRLSLGLASACLAGAAAQVAAGSALMGWPLGAFVGISALSLALLVGRARRIARDAHA